MVEPVNRPSLRDPTSKNDVPFGVPLSQPIFLVPTVFFFYQLKEDEPHTWWVSLWFAQTKAVLRLGVLGDVGRVLRLLRHRLYPRVVSSRWSEVAVGGAWRGVGATWVPPGDRRF